MVDLSHLKEQFNTYQEKAIVAGQNQGLDVSYYADPAFLPIQMMQIRIGLEQGLPVGVYANPKFDWYQMEEIREGLRQNVNVSVYANPDIPYEKMRQLRKGLAEGINLYNYVRFPAGVIKQIRKAHKANIDIQKYIEEGYDEEQLEQIRMALTNGIRIDPYISKKLRGISIFEIRLGLEKGLDVEVYANEEYDWRQMREIRLGMESRIQYTKYANPLYSYGQMREIRLGLESGLDVRNYCSLMYPTETMRKRRRKLLAEETYIPQEVDFEGTKTDDFQLSISDTGMEAFLKIDISKKLVSREEIERRLKENGVVAGFIEENISGLAHGQYNGVSVQVARGEIPHMGKDGWYEYFFRTNVEKRPRVLENGDVDYQNVEWVETVKEGQKLAFYHPAEPGTDGYTVTGKVLRGKLGRQQPLLNGKGFILDKDKRTYYAAFDGMITIDNFQMVVSRKMVLEEVTMATGNLHFDGSIHILGKVGNGTTITATDDIIIDGFVGSSKIECGGKIIMKQGMNAGGNGYVKGKKGVASRFFETTEVYSEGDVQTNYSLNSKIYTEGQIYIIDRLAGGSAYAEKGFKSFDVGNKAGILTNLVLGTNPALFSERHKLERKIRESEQELISLKESYKEFKLKYPPEVRNGMEMFLKVEDAIYTLTKTLEEMYGRKRILDKSLSKINDAKMEIRGTAYEGVVVEIAGNVWRARNQYNIVLRRIGNNMEVYTNT